MTVFGYVLVPTLPEFRYFNEGGQKIENNSGLINVFTVFSRVF